ncbi:MULTISPECIES: hypothetical protein [Caproicibacterium]|uniref:Uncharacterized protein n=1 Tax=Caproicibacterium argilliputei TaxID=3030016 RepID=A0AA97D9L0_9FIRM|nr:hypothetical protein [Caproicibacterium argilliputei]WOC32289.1 hypothetical protein PXC00_00035 [Caproicibacterium argilliputei]
MHKETTACPWCGAHCSEQTGRAALQAERHICPVCGRPSRAVRSKKRIGVWLLLAAVLCLLDFLFLVLGVPLLPVFLLTAGCTACLWCFRGHTVVFRKITDA